MQEKRPDFPRRSASFNPEAETFSPAPAKIGAADIDTKLTPRMNSPQRLSVLEMYEGDYLLSRSSCHQPVTWM